MGKKVTSCNKCELNFEGRLKVCPVCENKAYLRYFDLPEKAIVVTSSNRAVLENHCKTKFTDDVLWIIPPVVMSTQGYEELKEEEQRRAEVRAAVTASRKRQAEKKKKNPKNTSI